MLRTRGRLALLLGLTGRVETSLAMFDDVIAQETRRSGKNSDPVADYLGNRAVLLGPTTRCSRRAWSYSATR